jgi:hypothetical protein
MNRSATITVLVLLLALGVAAERWPMGDGDSVYPLGNNYGEFQSYSSDAYYHDGIDVLGYSGEPNYSVFDGYLVLKQEYEPLYSGIMIGEGNGPSDGWVHWHLTYSTIPFNVGDPVYTDDHIGDLADWPVDEFHHDHFTRMYYTGSWYEATGNPLEWMVPNTDPDAPVFRNARGDDLFAFRTNELAGPTYHDPDALEGEVDIVALIGDLTNHPTWELAPYTISWWVDGSGGSVPETTFVTFTGDIPPDNTVEIIHSTDSVCFTRGNYDYRNFYYIITNTDGDGVPDYLEHLEAWDTTLLPDGDYTVYVKAVDQYDNETTESMAVTIDNLQTDIVLAAFEAQPDDEGLLLHWQTTGDNPAGYRLLRSRDGEAWSVLHDRPLQSSGYLDRGAPADVELNYRLEALGADGRPVLLGELTARRQPAGGPALDLAEPWPNPARGPVNVLFELPAQTEVVLAVYDTAGRRVATLADGALPAGRHNATWNAQAAPGLYLLRLETAADTLTRRVVVQR